MSLNFQKRVNITCLFLHMFVFAIFSIKWMVFRICENLTSDCQVIVKLCPKSIFVPFTSCTRPQPLGGIKFWEIFYCKVFAKINVSKSLVVVDIQKTILDSSSFPNLYIKPHSPCKTKFSKIFVIKC